MGPYVTQGSIHQGQVGQNRGKQCTAVAILALAIAYLGSPIYWTSTDIDTIVLDGNSLYDSTVGTAPPEFLGHEDFIGSEIHANSHGQSAILEPALQTELLYGTVGNDGNIDSGESNIDQAISAAYALSNYVLATFHENTIALIEDATHGYTIFDSHSRDTNGQPHPDGTAIAIHFDDYASLIAYISHTYSGIEFILSPVTFTIQCNSLNSTYQQAKSPSNSTEGVQQCGTSRDPVSTQSSQTNILTSPHSPNNQDNMANIEDDISTIPASYHRTEDEISTIPASCHSSDVLSDRNDNDINFTHDDNRNSFPVYLDHGYCQETSSGKHERPATSPQNTQHIQFDHAYDWTSANIRFNDSEDMDINEDNSYTTGFKIYDAYISHGIDSMLKTNTTKDIKGASSMLISENEDYPFVQNERVIQSNSKESFNPVNHIMEYEYAIRERLSTHCESCHRLLFPYQIKRIGKVSKTAMQLGHTPNSDLCTTCATHLKQNKIPTISAFGNSLYVPPPPYELMSLNRVEKRLLAIIQVFITQFHLPGGQYAQRGLVLNIPVNILDVMTQSSNLKYTDSAIVHYETSPDLTPKISPQKVHRAFQWLKKNNILYSNVNLETPMDVDNSSFISHHANEAELEDIAENVLIPTDYAVPTDDRKNIFDANPTAHIHIPRSNMKPLNIYEQIGAEEKAFPWLFPTGQNGFKPLNNKNRKTNITPSMYWKIRLMNKEDTWRTDMTYVLHARISHDIMQAKSDLNIHLRMEKPNSDRQKVTAKNVFEPSMQSELVGNSYMFLKHIGGTDAYLKDSLQDLLAQVKFLGPPTLFVTLSADDLSWPELGMLLRNITYEEASKMKSNFEHMRNDPVLSGQHFWRRYQSLFKHVIQSDLKPLGGKVIDSFVRIEHQNRGSPHLHIFYWIDVDLNSPEDVIQYIDKTISTMMPNEESDPELYHLVNRVQTHHHSDGYCMKDRRYCRFGFPYPATEKTHLLKTFNMCNKRNRGRMYATKRDEQSSMINAYNPIILRHWRANMDISYIYNAESLAYYVCKYVCKSEPNELKTALHDLMTNIFAQHPEFTKRQKLFKIAMCVLKHRRMGAYEAAMKLCGIPYVEMSRKVVYVNARQPNKRYRRLKHKAELEQLAESNPDSTDIFMDGIIESYHSRPDKLEHMSLYSFACWYEKTSGCNKAGTVGKQKLERLQLKNGKWIKQRLQAAVIRTPNFQLLSEDNFYNMLLLHLPHRQETELLHPYNDAKTAFEQKHELLTKNSDCHFSLVEEVENAMHRIRIAQNEIDAINEDEDPAEQELNLIPDDVFDDIVRQCEVSNQHLTPGLSMPDTASLQSLHDHCQQVCPLTPQEYNTRLNALSKSQSDALKHISDMATKQEPFFTFISGGAGTGKSFLAQVLITYLEMNHASVPGLRVTRTCTPTGTAATQIPGAQTIHSLLRIPLDLDVKKPSPVLIKYLKDQLKGCKFIIIDEISMVSEGLLDAIHTQLCHISGIEAPFGGFSIIVIGDFCQIKPVNAPYCFEKSILWSLFEAVFLKENHRQSGDKSYTRLLNRARVGLLSQEDHLLLKSRVLVHMFDIRKYPGVLRIFPKKSQVDEFNKLCQADLPSTSHVHQAENYFSQKDWHPGADVPHEDLPEKDKYAGNLCNELILAVGSRVMLTQNINIKDGLVNGVLGVVTKLDFKNAKLITVHVKFDKLLNKEKGDDSIAIEIIEREFFWKGRHIIRRTFPLQLSWAATIHKVQGASLTQAVIYLGSEIFDDAMAYVALSRVSSIDGLILCCYVPSAVRAPKDALEEYHRLRQKKN